MDFNRHIVDVDMTPERYHYVFIHNVFSNFFHESLDYFSSYLYPRFEYRVVGTYDKAVEYLQKTAQYDRETDRPQLPALVLTPLDFNAAEGSAGGRQYWRYPNLSPGLVKRLFDPVYQDKHVQVNVGFIRIKGEIELIMLCPSYYEYADLKMYMIQIFGGQERWIYPIFFTSFIIIPDELLNFEYNNEYTNVQYQLDWTTAGSYERLVKTTARNETVLPVTIKPIYRLMGQSDGNEKYGGTETLARYRLINTIEYEVEVPAFFILFQDYLAEGIKFELRWGSTYSAYSDYQPPDNRILKDYEWNFPIDETSNTDVRVDDFINDTESTGTFIGDFEYKTRYIHVVTQAEADSTSNVIIDLPEQITNYRLIIVNSKFGEMKYGDHFLIIDNGWKLEIKVDNVDLYPNMVIELYIYEKIS